MGDQEWLHELIGRDLCTIFVPSCYYAFYRFDDWLIVWGVPISSAVVGGLLFPRWRNALLVGAFCFLLHEVSNTLGFYMQFDEIWISFLQLPLTMMASNAIILSVLMAAVATVAHGARRLLLSAATRVTKRTGFVPTNSN
jgi:hypothetical protein